WVHSKRDHGQLIFIDLRDHYGITQIVFHKDRNQDHFHIAEEIRVESVVTVEGLVMRRSDDTINPALPTGEVEVWVETITVESYAQQVPFPIADEVKTNEELRLQWRFLDLRREHLHKNIVYRDKIVRFIRDYMHKRGFLEVQTPILANSSPEGARDFLVPSRLNPGTFYALPQAPQQFKQLLMVAGFDRYFQIAPCFRDEDARADRSPGEFYQLDLEMSFCTQEDVFDVVEGLFTDMTPAVCDKKMLFSPFPRLTFREAMDRYGTDKPDIRFEMDIQDVSEIFRECKLNIFAKTVQGGGVIKAIKFPGGTQESRSWYDGMEDFARSKGAKGLAYLLFRGDRVDGPIVKFLSEEEQQALIRQLDVKTGDSVFFSAGKWQETCGLMGEVRVRLANYRNIIPQDCLAFCWIVDFPMYEWNEIEKKVDFSHNPFSMPQGGLEALETKDPLDILAFQYDIVCNGVELSSGAIRNHSPEIMYKAFSIAGYAQEEVDRQFGHMIRAFSYGAPPHGGIAPGVDRIVMIYAEEDNLREITAFPKNQRAQDLCSGAPSRVNQRQLDELYIQLALPEE
ncbi:MAG: aspartate--tRNA ligase, partial [bacterium]